MAEIDIPQLESDTSQPRVLVRGSTNKPQEKTSIVTDTVVKKELTFGQKLKGAFLKEDLNNVRDYVIFEIIIPNVKQSIFDSITGIVGQMLGVNYSAKSSSRGYSGGKGDRPFRDYAQASRTGRIVGERPTRYDPYDVSDVVFKRKADALKLLEEIIDICDSSGWYSVERFYQRAGIPEVNNGYTNSAYGWHQVDGAEVISVPNGYIIDLPRARTR